MSDDYVPIAATKTKQAAVIQALRKAMLYASLNAASAAILIAGVTPGTDSTAAALCDERAPMSAGSSACGNPKGNTASAIFGARFFERELWIIALLIASPIAAPKDLIEVIRPDVIEINSGGVSS